ncbi:hypothetical protein GKODMF_13270 [Candidatus Electrothrix gigas]
MPTTLNTEKNTSAIQSIIGKKIAIESNTNYAFESLALIAKTYFESCGCKVIRFHRVLPSIKEIIKSKVSYHLPPHTKNSSNESVMPRLFDIVKWNIKSLVYSYYHFLVLSLHIKNIFELTIDGIEIGDQVVSDGARFRQKHITKSAMGLGLIKSLKDFYLSYSHTKYLINTHCVDVFMVSHLVYSWSMISKVAITLNKGYLYLGKYPYSILVTSEHSDPYHPKILSSFQKDKCSRNERKIAEKYMQERVTSGKKVLPHMEVNAYSGSCENFNHKYNNEKEIIHCCIFLHSFSDSLFNFGYDSFNNIWHWTEFTIERLTKNEKVKIFIKPHPNIAHKMKTGFASLKNDHQAFNLLKDKYEHLAAVEFLSPTTSNIDISSMNNFIGITHHGNVAPELAFLNKPIIASKHAPWKYFGDFLISWENKDEYEVQLSNIEKYIDFVPNKSKLLDFAYKYYIKPVLISDNKFYGNKLYEMIYNKDAKNLSETMQKSEEMLHIIRQDKNKLQEGLRIFDGMINQAIINGRNASKS